MALARMLQLEEQEQLQEQLRQMVEAQAQSQPGDDETMALVRRMQHEEEEQFQEQLRETERLQDEQMRQAGLVFENGESGSPGQLSYEQLTALGETVGTVSRGASDESIGALRTVVFKCCDASVNAGTKARRPAHGPPRLLRRSRHPTCSNQSSCVSPPSPPLRSPCSSCPPHPACARHTLPTHRAPALPQLACAPAPKPHQQA